MTIPSRLTFALGLIVLLLLQYTHRPLLAWRVEVDWQLIALVLLALRVRPAVAALAGFSLGLVMDAMVPAAFGAAALALTLVGYAAARFRTGFFGESVMVGTVIVGLGKVVADLAVMLAEGRLRGWPLVAQLGLWTPLSAILTATVGTVLLRMAHQDVPRPRRR
jgi:rod shape-determining protein MreD